MTPNLNRVVPFVWLAAAVALPGSEAHAQGITVDGRLSPAQTLAGPNYAIGAGLGRQVGGNLFHSFGAFGLKAGETATFSGPSSGVGNVIGRVTGGATSSINGGISSTIPGANLYLINPAGVVFGPNASVDVGGSFHASSADYLRMKDGARFQAANPDASTLTAAPPEAFGFLSAAPRPVMVNGSNLQLKQGGTQGGNTLGLVGGDVTISGGVLLAPGGTVHVASAAGPGEVPVDPRAGPAPTVARSGQVQVANSTLYPSGGSVFIRAGELVVSNSKIVTDDMIPSQVPGRNGVLSLHADRAVTISNGANVVASAIGSGRGPGISIGTAAGGTVTVDSALTTVATNATPLASGDGGPVAISTGTLTLRNGAVVVSNTMGRGNGGPISVSADSVLLDGLGTRIESQTNGVGLADAGAPVPAGTGGTISLAGGTLTVQNQALVEANTFGNGTAGSVNVAMAGNVAVTDGAQVMSNSNTGGLAATAKGGDAGTVTVNAGVLTLLRGGTINSDTSGSGNAGGIALAVAGALTIDGAGEGNFTNAVKSQAVVGVSGSTGPVQVTAGSVSVLNGGFISSDTFGTGRGGPVTVTTPGALLLDGGGGGSTQIGASAQEAYSGDAGSVSVHAGTATVQNGARIASLTYGAGPGGSITVNTGGALTLLRGGAITSDTFGAGHGGEIALAVGGALTIDGANRGGFRNGVSSEAAVNQPGVVNVSGPAGSVQVSAGSVSVLNGGFINSNTRGTGRGGSVAVTTPGALLLDGGGDGSTEIGASALGLQSGDAGTVTVHAGTATIQNGAQIASLTNDVGQGGSITVNTTGALALMRGGTISSNTYGAGNGGEIALAVGGALTIDGANEGAFNNGVSSEAAAGVSGLAGPVRVSAGSVSVLNGGFVNSNTRGTGRGGSVTVDSGAVTLVHGGLISSATYGPGNAGEVTLNVGGALLLDDQGAGSTAIGAVAVGPRSGNAGTVTITAGTVAVQGGAQIASSTQGPGRGGDVTVNTGALALLSAGSIASSTSGPGNAGEVMLNVGGPLTIDGTGSGGFGTGVNSEALGNSSGSAGTIQASAGSISISNGGIISSGTQGTGAGGSVLVTTPGALLLDNGLNDPTGIRASATGPRSGNAGLVTITAGTVAVQNGTEIASVTAGLGQGGGVTVNAGSLTVSSQGIIASSTAASGNAGEVTLNIAGPLTVDGSGGGGFAAGVNSEAGAGSSGSAGTIRASAGSVSVLNSGLISSSTRGAGAGGSVLVTTPGALLLDGQGASGNPGITASSLGPRSGNAGTVTVSAGTVTIQGGAQVASTTDGPGRGGDVSVTAGSVMRLNGPGPQVTATATGAGVAGSISMAAPQVFLRDGASVSTAAQSANGGNITVGPGDLLYLQRSSITTSVSGASGNGGNIATAPRLVVLDRSAIQANAVGGNGGNVQVEANQLVQSFDSAITASSQRGVSGAILVSAQPLNLNGSLVVLASELRAAAALLREGCAVRGAAPRSSLVAAGRGGQRQGLEATLPALYFAHRPVRDGGAPAAAATAADPPAAPQRISLGLSSACG